MSCLVFISHVLDPYFNPHKIAETHSKGLLAYPSLLTTIDCLLLSLRNAPVLPYQSLFSDHDVLG